MVGMVRWFFGALVVVVVSMTGIALWNARISSMRDVVLTIMFFVMTAAVYIAGAAVLAAALAFLIARFMRPGQHNRRWLVIGIGCLSGVAVMSRGMVGLQPDLLAMTAVAGGTGGALSVADSPLFSRSGLLTLLGGVTVSAALLIGTTLAMRGSS